MTLAEHYAQFASRLAWRDLPGSVGAIALELFADWLSNAAAGYASPLARALRDMVPVTGQAMRLGDLQAAEPLPAALINASAAHALEFDDSYRAGLYHPGAPVISAAFSAACLAGATGADLLCGLVAGYELSLRLAAAINPAHYGIWHTTGTVGAFGATAAAAHILGLSPEQTASALGLAGTQAAGLWEVLPDSPQAKNLHPAKAAHSGLLAALLAQCGIDGPKTIFEGKRGFFAATVPVPVDLEQCRAGLGKEWLTPETTFKAYPVCGHTMTPIEAAFLLAGRVNISEIEAIEVRAHPVSLRIASNPDPSDAAQAKFSIPYCVAAALCRGCVGLEEFTPETMNDPLIRRLLGRTTLVADDTLGRVPGQRPARIAVRLARGETLSAQADVRKGDPERPMTGAEKREKCLRLIASTWGRESAENIFAAVSALPEARNIAVWAGGLRSFIGRQHETK
ncbi:MAG: MmgE/PrpD family protein [Zoogloeaceae bacterium]|jgi:2-methylcitrate dehydratase PrpD|nr:MmgE/PrpD family protein [Zoogloeaceae bacterium]